MAQGTELEIDMRDIYKRQMLKLNSKPAISIFLGHLSPNRENKDAQETNKLELLLSFAKLRSVIEDELECVVIQRG